MYFTHLEYALTSSTEVKWIYFKYRFRGKRQDRALTIHSIF